MEHTPTHPDYRKNPSPSLQAIETAVDFCNSHRRKVEFVFFHCPTWATESGKAGGYKSRDQLFAGYRKRIAKYFKGRVHTSQLSHEANLQGLIQGAKIDFVINEIRSKAASAVHSVCAAEPKTPVIDATNGMSPCEPCVAMATQRGAVGKQSIIL